MNISPVALFSALASDIRLRCLVLLQRHGELCVCELTHALAEAQPKVSRHLAHLREAGLVSDRRQGLWIYYRLHPQLPDWAGQVLAGTEAGVAGQTPYCKDETRLAGMPNRPGASCCA